MQRRRWRRGRGSGEAQSNGGGGGGESKSDSPPKSAREQMSERARSRRRVGRGGRTPDAGSSLARHGAKRCRILRVNVEQAAPRLRPLCDLAPAAAVNSAVPTARRPERLRYVAYNEAFSSAAGGSLSPTEETNVGGREGLFMSALPPTRPTVRLRG